MNNREQICWVAAIIVSLTTACATAFAQPTPADQKPPANGVKGDHSVNDYIYSTDQGIQFFQDRVQRNPRDFLSLTMLGDLHARKGRETGDVSSYERAEASLRKALELHPRFLRAKSSLAAVLCDRHKFREGLELAQQVCQKDPGFISALATVADAQLALGNYPEAEKGYQELLRKHPDFSVLARVAHVAELKGQTEEALRLMQQAIAAGRKEGESPQSLAWYHVRRGDMFFNAGQFDQAAEHYETARKDLPDYPLALAGLGRVQAAKGRYAEAVELFRRAAVRMPDPSLVGTLGDLQARAGAPVLAQVAYRELERTARNQSEFNRVLSRFYCDHDLHLPEALALAEKELAVRKDIYAYDTLAWALYKNERHQDAAAAIREALKLGTRDATLYYHAGKIYAALGDKDKARSYLERTLALNPHFSILHEEDARKALAALGSGARTSGNQAGDKP
jgi:tetratricopeptide (TPR) repeat protein